MSDADRAREALEGWRHSGGRLSERDLTTDIAAAIRAALVHDREQIARGFDDVAADCHSDAEAARGRREHVEADVKDVVAAVWDAAARAVRKLNGP